MSRPYDGRGADPDSGSVRRARERAQGGYSQHQHTYSDPVEDDPPGELRAPPRRPMGGNTMGQPRVPRSKHAIDRSANPGVTISRPQPVPQWPLSGPPMAAMNQPDAEPYRPPPGRPTQAPQRPPRPSQVPSLLDQSRLQEPTPVFLTPETDDYRSSVPPSPSSRMTVSSLGSVPDFPEPNQTSAANRRSVNLGPPRASANLGPPPSSRRGVSSFYSRASFVSPIPEESLNSRSHGSYASSAAMPDSWPGGSGPGSPSFYDDGATERSQDYVEDDFHDESKLVRSASIGKRGKPSLITTKSFQMEPDHRPAPSPVQPFDSGTGYVDASTSSSNTLPMAKTPTPGQNARDSLSPDAILGAFAAASATNLTDSHVPAPSPSPHPWNRLSAIRRPPKLDIDAVRKAEERGSMTSLPDLIRRATRLATMIDHGKRPGSRFDNLNDFFDEKGQMRGGDKENSGLSDMLAAFPPPAQPTGRQSRGSWFRTTSWPLAPGPGRGDGPSRNGVGRDTPLDEGSGKRRRRCCGLPVWAFVILLILLLGIIVAAVLVPLEFFVFKNLGNHDKPQSALAQCQESLKCQNGGTNIMSQGTCSCICTNGFTGSDCSAEGSDGCTMTDLGGSLSNVTLGKNIPRLIEDSQKNFSIPLSGTAIMAKLNSQELSCIAQNSLVTFDGAAARKRNALLEQDKHEAPAASLVPRMPEPATAIVVSSETADPTKLIVDEGDPDKVPTTTATAGGATKTSATAVPSQTQSPTNKFQITNEVLDFARVAVLFVLQQENVDSAQDAQSSIDKFFAKARKDDGVLVKQAESVSIGDKSSVDLLRYKITIGSETIGGNAKRHLSSLKTTPTYVSVRHRAVHALRQHR